MKCLLGSYGFNIKPKAGIGHILPLMKTSEQSIKGEAIDRGASLSEAQMKVTKAEFDAAAAESEARNLEIELLKAEAAAEKKQEAEERGRETKDKISERVG